jgi:hypothetical protein
MEYESMADIISSDGVTVTVQVAVFLPSAVVTVMVVSPTRLRRLLRRLYPRRLLRRYRYSMLPLCLPR